MKRDINIDHLPDAVIIVSRQGAIVCVNGTALEMFGYREPELVGRPVEILVPARFADHARRRERYQTHPTARPMGRLQEIFGTRKDGTEFPIDISLRPNHETGEIACIVRDISDHVSLSDQIRKTAYEDAVTGLLNRHAFDRALAAATERARANGGTVDLAILDLDHFKEVNDSLGHSAGDNLLRCVAKRLFGFAQSCSGIYRIGGDEFAMMFECAGRAEVQATVNGALAALRRRFVVRDQFVLIGCSAGIAHMPEAGHDAEDLLRNADLALYAAKEIRGRSSVFSPEIRRSFDCRRALVSELQTAVEQNQFRMFYQAQINCKTGAVVGAEALIRWMHPERGLLLPDTFIPILTNSDMSAAVGRWTLVTACRQARQWEATTGRCVSVAVNMFPQQLASTAVEDVRHALAASGLAPQCLEVEITEDTLLESGSGVLQRLNEIRSMGVNIALDDFGTGYASLDSLTHAPITTVKLDRRFVRSAGTDSSNRPVLRAVSALARELRLTTVAEGIETAEDALAVQHFGYDLGQGYYWGRPVPADDFVAALAVAQTAARPGQPPPIDLGHLDNPPRAHLEEGA